MDIVTWGCPWGVKVHPSRIKTRAKGVQNLLNIEKSHTQALNGKRGRDYNIKYTIPPQNAAK